MFRNAVKKILTYVLLTVNKLLSAYIWFIVSYVNFHNIESNIVYLKNSIAGIQ